MSGCIAKSIPVINTNATFSGSIEALPAGLTVAGVIKETSVPDTGWVKIPTIPEPNRNALSIQNQTGTQIKIRYDDGGAGYTGVIVNGSGERFYQISDTIEIWARSSSGSVTILTEELV